MTDVFARGSRVLFALAALPLALGCSAGTDPVPAGRADLDGGSRAEAAAPSSCSPAGTGAVATLGCACSAPGERACAGNASTTALVCSEGAWTLGQTCGTGYVCDSTPGTDQGSCTLADPYCTGLASGRPLCVDAQTLIECNADLTSHTRTRCAHQACVNGACVGVCAPGSTRCTDGGVQTCGGDGTWGSPSACTGKACVNGACVGVCTPGESECSGGDLATCNAKGEWDLAPCVDGYCQAGKCVSDCVTGHTQCVGNAVETCGTGGTWGSPVECAGQTCVNGACAGVCAPGAVSCSGHAPESCNATGEWDVAANCPAPTTECSAGACLCPNGGTVCGGACVSLQTDLANCGHCGVACSAAGQTCSAGQCVCPYGEVACGGACVNPLSDPKNCGACGTTCSATGQSCDAGRCTCPAGALACNGACIDVQADVKNCGGCGVACAGTCAAGRCLSTLISGRTSPRGIVADGQFVAWTEPDAGNVMAMLPDGSGVRAIASHQGSPSAIAESYGTIYWTNTTSGEIMKAALASGAAVPFATNQSSPTTIAVDGSFGVSWIVDGNAIVDKGFTGNAGVNAWYSGSGVSGLAMQGSFTIWCDHGAVLWNEQAGIAPTALVWGQSPQCAFSLPESGSRYVVWTNSLSTNAVYAWYNSAFDVGGGPPPAVIATGPATQTRTAITQDGVSAYWTTSDGTILKVAITGGSPVTLATGQGTPGGIALDGASLYWTSASAGTVMKLTPR